MRAGQWIVIGLVGTALAVATGAWAFQRELATRRLESRAARAAELAREAEAAAREAAREAERRRAAAATSEGNPTTAPGDPATPPETSPGAADDGAVLAPQEVAPVAGGVAREWVEENARAIEALEAGELERAIELLDGCLAANPDHAVFRANLAEVLARAAIREHDVDPHCRVCRDRLARACALAPERADLARLLERWRGEAEVEGRFWRESSLHFDLSYDGERGDLLWGSTRLLDELERAYADLGELFAFYPVESGRPRFRVVLYERGGFARMTGLGEWAGGAYDGSAIRIPIADLSVEEARLSRVFRHELCHAFVREVGGESVPGWLNEGLAQWLEHPLESRRDEEARAARAALAGGEPIPLESMSGSLSTWKDEAMIARAYRQSLAFVGHLWREFGDRAVIAMVAAGKSGRSAADAFQASTRRPLGEVFEEWLRR